MIAGPVSTPNMKKFQSHISDFFLQKSPYAIIDIAIAHLPKLQLENLMARRLQKELVTPNINVYSGQLSKPWSEFEGVLY